VTLHLVYRSYGGGSFKQRPFYYSKMLALISFVRAATEVKGAELLFRNDGPIPDDKLAVMRRYGRIAQTGDKAKGMRASYRAALALNLRAHRQRTPHLLYTVTPNVATHMEHPVISPDRDWVAVADEVAQWAEDNRSDAPSSAIRERLSRVT
jgi:hypothetical protein